MHFPRPFARHSTRRDHGRMQVVGNSHGHDVASQFPPFGVLFSRSGSDRNHTMSPEARCPTGERHEGIGRSNVRRGARA